MTHINIALKEQDMSDQRQAPELLEAMRRCASRIPESLAKKILPEQTAILVIDIQNDFCHNNGIQAKRGLDVNQAQEMVPNLLKFLNEARKYHLLIIYIRYITTKWSLSPVLLEPDMKYPEHLRPLCQEGTWGSEFYKVSPQKDECVVDKHRFDAFTGNNLEQILRTRGIKTVIITGVATPVCVESTAREGFARDFFVVIVKDCVAARIIEEHDVSLSILNKFFATAAISKEIITSWSKES
ncbi:cysteine hydrolase family protein [Chloroflexota bacterium]